MPHLTLFTLLLIHTTHYFCFVQSFPSPLRYYVSLQMILIKSNLCHMLFLQFKKKIESWHIPFLVDFYPTMIYLVQFIGRR